MSEIDLTQMEKLIALMVENDLTELQYCQGELQIELKRSGYSGNSNTSATLPGLGIEAPSADADAPAGVSPTEPEDESAGLVPIASPMVGTFYAAPDPESPPFVTVGCAVQPDSTVCLIEAMKVFNEIKAETSGTIERIAVSNAEAVEFGQPLYYVRPT